MISADAAAARQVVWVELEMLLIRVQHVDQLRRSQLRSVGDSV
jgi:hypothetical protein